MEFCDCGYNSLIQKQFREDQRDIHFYVGLGYSIPAYSPEEAEAKARSACARLLRDPSVFPSIKAIAAQAMRRHFLMKKRCDMTIEERLKAADVLKPPIWELELGPDD